MSFYLHEHVFSKVDDSGIEVELVTIKSVTQSTLKQFNKHTLRYFGKYISDGSFRIWTCVRLHSKCFSILKVSSPEAQMEIVSIGKQMSVWSALNLSLCAFLQAHPGKRKKQ